MSQFAFLQAEFADIFHPDVTDGTIADTLAKRLSLRALSLSVKSMATVRLRRRLTGTFRNPRLTVTWVKRAPDPIESPRSRSCAMV